MLYLSVIPIFAEEEEEEEEENWIEEKDIDPEAGS
jgi:hypothetical protein